MNWRLKGGEERKLAATDPAACTDPAASQSAEPSPSEVQPRNRGLSVAVCVFLALIVGAVFGRTVHYGFVNYDDDRYVYENGAVAQGFSLKGIVWAFTHTVGDNWHPLTTLSHMLDCQFYGLSPGGHHLTNVMLHAATAILLFLVLRNLTGALWRAAFVAAVFAIHPLRVESVAWVAERKDVLSGLFFMLTLWAYGRFAKAQEGKEVGQRRIAYSVLRAMSSRFYWLALVFFALGLMSKPMLVTLPFVLLLLDYWPLRRLKPAATASDAPRLRLPAWWRLVLEKVPFMLLSAALCVATLLAQKNVVNTVQGLTLPWRIGNAVVAYAVYLWQMVYPVGLAVLYPHPGNHLSVWSVGWAALALLIISAGVLAGRRSHPYLLMGWLWYLGMLVPVIGLVQVGDQARADRYTYLPQVGLYMLVTWGVAELCGAWRYRRIALGFGATAILAGLLAAARTQTGYWQDSVSLWIHTLGCTSENYIAQNNLGYALAEQGKLAEAIPHYEWSLQFKPDYVDAHNNLGAALADEGKLNEAIQHYEQALQRDPNFAKAHYNLGNALAGQGRMVEAIQHYERALELNPDFVQAQHNLGSALASQGRLAEAVQHYERALELKPDFADAHYNLGNVLAAQGKPDEAAQQFQQALNLATARNNTALAEASRARLKSLPQARTP